MLLVVPNVHQDQLGLVPVVWLVFVVRPPPVCPTVRLWGGEVVPLPAVGGFDPRSFSKTLLGTNGPLTTPSLKNIITMFNIYRWKDLARTEIDDKIIEVF